MKELRSRKGRALYKSTWKEIRYGWCLGDESFKEKILDKVGLALKGKDRLSYSGKCKKEYDEFAAEKLLRKGLKALGVKESELKELRKGDDRKKVLAFWVHSRTMAGHKWIATRLGMGCPSNMSNYIKSIKESKDRHVKKLLSAVSDV